MSWSRAKYDDCTYKHNLSETIGPGEYMTQTPTICDNCVYYAPGVAVDRRGAAVYKSTGDLINNDSELIGISRRYSQCPADKYIPSMPTNKEFVEYKECDALSPEPTLVSNPKCTNKETTVNRWEWLCKNPQDSAIVPFDFLINNRTIVKDNHRPLIEQPFDGFDALPPSTNDCISYDWFTKWKNAPAFPLSTQLGSCKNIY